MRTIKNYELRIKNEEFYGIVNSNLLNPLNLL